MQLMCANGRTEGVKILGHVIANLLIRLTGHGINEDRYRASVPSFGQFSCSDSTNFGSRILQSLLERDAIFGHSKAGKKLISAGLSLSAG